MDTNKGLTMAQTTQRRYDIPFPELDYTWQGNKLVATDENGFRDFAYTDSKLFTDEGKKLALMGINRNYLNWLQGKKLELKDIYYQCKSCKELLKAKMFELLDMGNRNKTCRACYAILQANTLQKRKGKK